MPDLEYMQKLQKQLLAPFRIDISFHNYKTQPDDVTCPVELIYKIGAGVIVIIPFV